MYAIPAGMYASQVRVTPFLQQGKEMDNPLQKWLLTVLKRILMVKDTTPSWCVMRKCDLESLYSSTGYGRQCDSARERHLDFWTPYFDMHPRESISKHSAYHQWCALPTKRALVTHSPYTPPKYMLLDLPPDIIRSVARFRLRAHTLRIETMTWTHNTSPGGRDATCDLCNFS